MEASRNVTSNKFATVAKTVVSVLLFIFYMFPFYLVVLNSLKDKRDILLQTMWKHLTV